MRKSSNTNSCAHVESMLRFVYAMRAVPGDPDCMNSRPEGAWHKRRGCDRAEMDEVNRGY
jgi:hypothetical protein